MCVFPYGPVRNESPTPVRQKMFFFGLIIFMKISGKMSKFFTDTLAKMSQNIFA